LIASIFDSPSRGRFPLGTCFFYFYFLQIILVLLMDGLWLMVVVDIAGWISDKSIANRNITINTLSARCGQGKYFKGQLANSITK
jgi:hypothetical protein